MAPVPEKLNENVDTQENEETLDSKRKKDSFIELKTRNIHVEVTDEALVSNQ